jgi:hypothetical protein
VVAIAAALVAAAACSGPGGDAMGDAMVDVGAMLQDVGADLRADAFAADAPGLDAPSNDVAIPVDGRESPRAAVTVACDTTYVRTWTSPTATITTTDYYAELDAPGISTTGTTIPRFWVRLCQADQEWFGSASPGTTCPAGYTCTGETRSAASTCYASGGQTYEDGRVVINCGQRSQTNFVDPGTADTDSGVRWRRVAIELE